MDTVDLPTFLDQRLALAAKWLRFYGHYYNYYIKSNRLDKEKTTFLPNAQLYAALFKMMDYK